MKKEEIEMAQEYKDFIQVEVTHRPSVSATNCIHQHVMKDLDPSWSSVMIQLLLIHLLISSLTLTICPQFGIGPIGGGQGLMSFVEPFGHLVCGAFCGVFFFSGSVVAASWALSPAQKRKIYASALGSFSVLGLISLGTLILMSSMMKGGEPHLHLEFIAVWLSAGVSISYLLSRLTMKPSFIRL